MSYGMNGMVFGYEMQKSDAKAAPDSLIYTIKQNGSCVISVIFWKSF